MESILTEQPVARTVRLHPSDDVVIAVGELPTGTTLEGEGVRLRQAVPAGHKVATRAIPAGAPVHKYNQIIGFATQPIAPGDHVHVHNLGMH
ncbi:MAG: UxaA family hydrolase, partial [Verrucomicrobia bacterium]|nr:UxaA family hydrolase [Verrucomicrobiota bacterium]